MSSSDAPRISVLGYALGVGLAVMAMVGAYVHFAFADAPDWAMFAVAFAAGAGAGAWRARAAGLRHGESD
jgi:hypothetical protein